MRIDLGAPLQCKITTDYIMEKIQFSWALRFCVSAMILGLIFWLVPIHELWDAFRGISLSLWVFVLFVFLVGHVGTATKWWFLACRDSGIPWITSVRAHFAGLLANLWLPGVSGGDVIRAAWVMRGSKASERIGVASVADRLIDCVALILLVTGGGLWAMRRNLPIAGPLIVVVGFIGLGIATFTLLPFFLQKYSKSGIVQRIATGIIDLKRRPLRLLGCLMLSLIVQSSFVWLNVLLGAAMGLSVPAHAWFVAWPLAKLVAVIPISLAGLGVRESSLVAVLAWYQAPAAPVVATGILWQTILFSGGILGGVVVTTAGNSKHPVAVSAKNPSA